MTRRITLCLTLCLGLALAWPAVAVERAIIKEVLVNATPDQLWEAWTTREGIVSFFAPDARVEPRVGGAFHIHCHVLNSLKTRFDKGPLDWTPWLKQLEASRAGPR